MIPRPAPNAAVSVDPHEIDISTGREQMSHTKVLRDPRSFRTHFAEYWSRFLRENYRSPEHVAVAFGVRYQTANNWWAGAHRPTGDVVAMAGQPFTDFLRELTP